MSDRDLLLSVLVEALAFHGFDQACEMDALDMAYALIDRCPEPDGPGLGSFVADLRESIAAEIEALANPHGHIGYDAIANEALTRAATIARGGEHG